MTARQPIVATLAEARLLELVPALVHRVLRTPAATLFGYDFFVSYARRDASRYAERLFQELESRGYVTCFDRSDLNAGERLPDALARACARSRCTVLVDTVAARESRYVADEIGRVERKGRKGHLIRVMAPKMLPLGFASPPEPARTWAHLPAAAQDLLANAIGVDDAVDARGLAEGAVSSGVAGQIIKQRRRLRTLRRFGAAAFAVVGALAYVGAAFAWQRVLASEARALTASAVSVNAGLAELYSRARTLGNRALMAAAIPMALPLEVETDVQRALRAVLRVTAAPLGAPIPVAIDAAVRRVAIAEGGGGVAWRGRDGGILALRPPTAAREFVLVENALTEGSDPILDWTVTMEGTALQAVVARRDRFETWPAGAGGVRTCRPRGIAWERAVVSGSLALVAATDGVAVIDVPGCTMRWHRRIDALGGHAVGAIRLAASTPAVVSVDTGNALHVLDAGSGTPLHRGTYAQPIGEWTVDTTGRLLAGAIGDSYFALAAAPSASLDEGPQYSHPQGPILGVAFSPDGAVLVSSTAGEIRLWRTTPTDSPIGPLAMRELFLPWSTAGVAFTAPRAAFFVMPPLGARVGAELQPLQIPDGLEFATAPLPIGHIKAVHAQETIAAIEGADAVQLVAVAPAAFWADRVAGGDLPEQAEAANVDAASLLQDGSIEVRLAAGVPDGTVWRLAPGHESWRPASPAPTPAASVAPPSAGAGTGCRTRTSIHYAVIICAEQVRLYRRSGESAAWALQADLTCAMTSTECRPPAHPVAIRDVALDEDKDRLVALHVAGRRFFTVTYPLSTKGLRNAVASIDDALAR